MTTVLIISIIIIVFVIAISALTTSKAYSYKHTVDEIPHQDKDHAEDSLNKMNKGD